MNSSRKPEIIRRNLAQIRYLLGIFLGLAFSFGFFLWLPPFAEARSAATPWTNEVNFQSLVYGSSTGNDVTRALGEPPDEIIRAEQMFPVLENYFYYDKEKSGAATVFVFENGLLVGMQYKTPENQYVDMTYFLTNNGDRALNYDLLGGYFPYYPYFPYVTAW